MIFILKCIYFMLPAYLANMAPVIVKKSFKKLAIPVNTNIFGKNKTYRGLIFGILFAIIIAFIQYLVYPQLKDLSFLDYSNWFKIGFLMGFGAVFGDIIESLVKRRLKYKPGQPFVPLDQLDFVLGSLLFISLIFIPTIKMIITIIIVSFILHVLVNHSAYYLKIRNEKW